MEQPSYSKIIVEDLFDGTKTYKINTGGWNFVSMLFAIFALVWNGISYSLLFAATDIPIAILWTFIPLSSILLLVFLISFFNKTEIKIGNGSIIKIKTILGIRTSETYLLQDITDIGQGVAYSKNYQPVFQIQIRFQPSGKMKFGTTLSPDEKRWIIAEIEKAKSRK